MIVRQATLLDLLIITPLGSRYTEEALGHKNYPLDIDACIHNAASTILSDNGCFLLAFDDNKNPVGFLWGHAHALPWSKAKLAFDTILYVIPEKRKSSAGYKLMKSWEEWAKEKDAVEVQISIASGIHEDETTSFYKRLGYSYIGKQFRKECK